MKTEMKNDQWQMIYGKSCCSDYPLIQDSFGGVDQSSFRFRVIEWREKFNRKQKENSKRFSEVESHVSKSINHQKLPQRRTNERFFDA
jgi:hypothetical protein